MSTIPNVINRTMAYGDWLFDSQKQAQDEAEMAAWDRRQSIEDAVDFSDLLEEQCEFTPEQRKTFMNALARGERSDLAQIHCFLLQAKEAIVKRRLAGGE